MIKVEKAEKYRTICDGCRKEKSLTKVSFTDEEEHDSRSIYICKECAKEINNKVNCL